MDDTCTLLHTIITKAHYGLTFTELKQKIISDTGEKINEATLSNHLKHLLLSNLISHSNKLYAPKLTSSLTYNPPILHKKINMQLTWQKNSKKYQIYKYKKSWLIKNLRTKPLGRYFLKFYSTKTEDWTKVKITTSNDKNPKRLREDITNPYEYFTYIELFPPLLQNEEREIVFETEMHLPKNEGAISHFITYPVQEVNFSILVPHTKYDLEVYKIPFIDFDWIYFHQEDVKKNRKEIFWKATLDINEYEPEQSINFHWIDKKSGITHMPKHTAIS